MATMLHTWHWRNWNGIPYLTTSLLAGYAHGFFTRLAWPQTPEGLTPGLATGALVYRAKQVHGNRVVDPEAFSPGETAAALLGQGEPGRPEADAVVTAAPQQAAWVCSADCTPALIADMHTGQVAAIHAGWRGTALKVLPIAIAHMQAAGSQLADLRVAMGPAIAGEVYQVSETVAAEVGRTVITAGSDAEVVAQLGALSPAPVLADPHPGRVRLDVRRINAMQLEHLGFAPEQVAIAPHCTYQEPDRFFSYRRTKEKKVQWSGIVSQGNALTSPAFSLDSTVHRDPPAP